MVTGRVDPDCDLRADQFYDPRNAAIYRVMVELEGEAGQWDTPALVGRLQSDALWGKDGFGTAYVAEVFRSAGNPAIGAYHARQIKEAARRRIVRQQAEQLLQLSQNGFDSEALQSTIGKITEAVSDASGSAETSPRFIATLMTSAELDDLDAEPRYIVKNAVPAGQVGAIGAKSKGCKTGIATDLTISVASGTSFLNQFEVPQPAPVLCLCGESGASKIRRQARQICAARGLVLRDLPIFWGFDLPKLCLPFHVDALREFITQNKIALVIIDPLYLSLFTAETAGRSGDLYTMGATFEPLTAVCRDTGASILLVHHFRKNRGDDQQETCSLEELSQAGLAEVVRWWLLIERREPYAGDGRHALWLRVGGSEGHASFWGLDIDEGLTVNFEGNQRTMKWETTLARVEDTKAEIKQQREKQKAADQEKREGEHRERLLTVLRTMPEGDTGRALSGAAGLNPTNFHKAITALLQEGRAERCKVIKHKRAEDGFKPTGK